MELGALQSGVGGGGNLLPNVRAQIATRRATTSALQRLSGPSPCFLLLLLHPLCEHPPSSSSSSVFLLAGRGETAEGEPPDGADVHLFLCFSPPTPPTPSTPLDRRRYGAGTGLCVSAALRAPWRRGELQTLCFRPHASHTLHAGGGDDQLVVVRMSFFFSFSALYLTAVCL